MQSFFRANSNTNQNTNQNQHTMQDDMHMQHGNMQDDMHMQHRSIAEDMPMREPVYTQNMPDSQTNMTDSADMRQNRTMPMQQQMQTDMHEERRVPDSQQPTRPSSHGFVAPSGNDNYFENSVAYQGAMQQILSENTGEFVSVDFLIGTQETVTRRGILYAVGVSYIVLYNPEDDTYVVCDLFAIKFVTFYNTTQN